MEKQEYVQRFEFSTITPFKDYSRLDEKPNTPNTFVTEQEEEDDWEGVWERGRLWEGLG